MGKKIFLDTAPYLAPIPAAMVTCGSMDRANIITIAWTGIVCSKPPMTYVSVTPERYSHAILLSGREFVINLTNKELTWQTHWCGSKSGRDYNKFREMNLTPTPASKVNVPLIKECPLHLECKVTEIKTLGSHDMFLAEIVAVQADEKYISTKTGKFDAAAAELINFIHGKYYATGGNTGGNEW